MTKILTFAFRVIKKIKAENLSSTANDMTYKLLLSMFPFMIFLLALMGVFNLDVYALTQGLGDIIPGEILSILEVFTAEVVNAGNTGLLSLGLVLAVFSATSGFKTLMAGIGKAYSKEETRGFIKVYALSFVLVTIFAAALIISIITIIFGSDILRILSNYFYISDFALALYNILSIIISVVIMLVTTIIINKIALPEKVSTKKLLPGSFFTVIIWIIASSGFNVYVANFGNMSAVYGSLAGIVVLMIWLNIVCNVMLVGSAINGVLME